MDLLDSHNVNNRVKKRTVATAVLVHLYLTVITLGFWLIPLSLFSLITAALLRNDIDEAISSANSFNKALPFKYFGQVTTHKIFDEAARAKMLELDHVVVAHEAPCRYRA